MDSSETEDIRNREMVESNQLQKIFHTDDPSEQELFYIVLVQCLMQQGHVLMWLSNNNIVQMK